MSLKAILIILSCAYFIEATVISLVPADSNLSNCVDKDESCKDFASFCELHPPLKEACPRTCGACDFTDPCAENNGGCLHFCAGINEAKCSCRDGYQLADDGKTCIDIDECQEEVCFDGSACVNTVGSYSCQHVNCNDLGIGLDNYYKSDQCCVKNSNEFAQTYTYGEESEPEPTFNEFSSTQWAWMGQLLTKSNHHVCGAVLIAESWLVTSARCVDEVARDELKVVLGDNRNAQFRNAPKANRVERNLIQIIVHPDSTTNDIALLKLDTPVEFNQLIQPISLPCDDAPQVGSTCYVTGFGLTDDEPGALLSRNLKEIALPIVSSVFCNFIYQQTTIKFDSRTMMCAGHLGGGKDACFGDGGGPLVCQRPNSCAWYLSGIVSNGRGCGEVGFPGIYTRVAQFQSWISNVLGNDFTSQC